MFANLSSFFWCQSGCCRYPVSRGANFLHLGRRAPFLSKQMCSYHKFVFFETGSGFLLVCIIGQYSDHVQSYQNIPPSSILNHAYWYWVLAQAICCFMMTDYAPSYQSIPPNSNMHIGIGYWSGLCVVS